MNINLQDLTISKAKSFLQNGDVSARELFSVYFENIKDKNKNLNAYLEVFNDAQDMAEEIDKRIKSGQSLRALEGIPFAIKDNILIKGQIASASSKILENYRASYDSFVVKRLRQEGAIFLGRVNMDEFAMGSSTENSVYGPTKNPHDQTRVPGGSSGGSAAAVASGMALAALGSDTGGSIRQPAAFCGVVGLKPTYGAVSRNGLIAMASSLDQIGPITKTVEDAQLIFDVIKGKDLKDATSVKQETRNKIQEIKSLTIGIPKEYFDPVRNRSSKTTVGLSAISNGVEFKDGGADEDMIQKVNEAIEVLKSEGIKIKEVSLPYTDYGLAVYYIIMPAEVSANLARFDGVRYGFYKGGKDLIDDYMNTKGKGFSKETRRRIILGTYVLSAGYYDAYYGRAQKVRGLIKKDFENVFDKVDVLITPTSPTPAFKIGEKTKDPLSMYLSDVFTVPVNLAGVPAISVPFGKVERESKKLPVGVQLIAPWFGEELLFKLGKILENK